MKNWFRSLKWREQVVLVILVVVGPIFAVLYTSTVVSVEKFEGDWILHRGSDSVCPVSITFYDGNKMIVKNTNEELTGTMDYVGGDGYKFDTKINGYDGHELSTTETAFSINLKRSGDSLLYTDESPGNINAGLECEYKLKDSSSTTAP